MRLWSEAHWQHPGLQSWAEAGRSVQSALDLGLDLATALNARARQQGLLPGHDLPKFVPHTPGPAHQAYEQFVHDQGQVPTRPNAHDAFNGLCWLRLPRLKSHFNRLQAQAIARDGVGGQRGRLRDAITLFDEYGLWLQAPDELWNALVAREWTLAFVGLRSQWASVRCLIAGHALLENLLLPFKAITAHVLRWPSDLGASETLLDAWAVPYLSEAVLVAKPFSPLPVMGIPGWMSGQDAAFYADTSVFRPRR